jgi:hypothetical protein
MSVQKNVDDDILKKRYFSRAHNEERKGLETGLTAVVPNRILEFEEGGKSLTSGHGDPYEEGLETKLDHRCHGDPCEEGLQTK